MKIEIAPHGRMTESGSSLLRLIQNQDIPLLDLLVRESIQNSLDAASKDHQNVNVQMTVGEFQPESLNAHFEKIAEGLNRRYHDEKYQYIAIRDSNTVGLTGPVRYSDVKGNTFGNLLKLVYEICKPQLNEGAGGSWGLGKTIYFRLGIGLVIYYSRIMQGGKYRSRLAACLVENENMSNALIPYSGGVKRGIAWWGKRDRLGSSDTVPIDNKTEIRKILDIFGIEPYSGEETGTTIIVPYINPKALLGEVYPTNEPVDCRPYWAGDVAEYLRVAIQRWYAPRLNNKDYPYGSYLSASVNEEKIKVSNMLPLFRYIRELYILSTGNQLDEEALLSAPDIDLHVDSIDLRGVLQTTSSGKLAYAKLNRKQLQMDPPLNQKTPYQQILNISVLMEGGNGPIMAYTRRPGMVVGYDYDGSWTHRMPKTNADEYVIGVFSANSDNILKNITDKNTGKQVTLEEYIRQGEKADHASWADHNLSGNNPRIIANIQKNVIARIKREYSEPVKELYERQHVGLGHALADILLPAADFGKLPDIKSDPPEGGKKVPRNIRKSALHITGKPRYSDGRVTFEFDVHLKKKPCLLELKVVTDFKKLEADQWEDENEIGRPFPLEFSEICITHIQKLPKDKKNSIKCDVTVTKADGHADLEGVSVSFRKSEKYGVWSSVEIIPEKADYIVSGSFTFTFEDASLKGACDLKELNNE